MFPKGLFLFLIFIRLHYIFGCDESESDVTDTSDIGGEYQYIFKTIPSLFEYLMDLIQEKPEILEKDDITVFTRDAAFYNDDPEVVVEPVKKLDGDEGSEKNLVTGETVVENKGSKENLRSEEGSAENIGSEEDKNISETLVENEGSKENLKSEEGSAENLGSEEVEDNEEDKDSDEDDYDFADYENLSAFDFWEWYVGTVDKARLTLSSSEVAEMTLEIEKILEEYNAGTK